MNFVLIFIFSLSLFFYGRSKTKSISIEQNIKLNALPKFYGYYLVLWCSIPALIFLLIWSLFEPTIIKSIIIEVASNQGAIFNDKNEANLIYEKIKAIHLGTYIGDIDSILRESALSYAKFINLFTNSKIVLIFGIVIASVIYSLNKIKNNNKARDDVEVILKGLLFVSSLIAILTTLGIIFSLLFESIKFFSVINIFDYLFGTNWSPQKAFVRDASLITEAEYAELKDAFGFIPLIAGTSFIAEYASLKVRRVSKPIIEAYSAIYIPEKSPTGTATNIAINAINDVPAISGIKPNASFNSAYSASVIKEASFTNAF